MLAAIVAYAAQSGAVVVAEGIETREIPAHLVGAAKSANGGACFVGDQGYTCSADLTSTRCGATPPR